MTARCERALGVEIRDYLDEPTADRWLEFTEHLRNCSVCAAEVRAWDALRATKDNEDHPHEDVLLDYVDDRSSLGAQTIERIEVHLAVCASCRDEVAVLTQIDIEPVGAAAEAQSPSVGGLTQFLARLRPVIWNPAFAYVLVAILLVPTLSRFRPDEPMIVHAPAPAVEGKPATEPAGGRTDPVLARHERLRALGYMDGGSMAAIDQPPDAPQREEKEKDRAAYSPRVRPDAAEGAFLLDLEKAEPSTVPPTLPAEAAKPETADKERGRAIDQARRRHLDAARRHTPQVDSRAHSPRSTHKTIPVEMHASPVQGLAPGGELTIPFARARDGLTFYFELTRTDEKKEDSKASTPRFVVPPTVKNVEVRILTADGERQIRYRALAAPNTNTATVMHTVRIPGEWFLPGPYRVTIHAQDSDAPLAAPFSIEVAP